uniref:DNA (cytosine-5-)-methyltransferase n=1 Tax=Leersia perrieri TaxID=77586 RepID=A0A0D9UW97_9ORYZ
MEAEELAEEGKGTEEESIAKRRRTAATRVVNGDGDESVDRIVLGEPVPGDEARRRWPESSDEEEEMKARCHYKTVNVNDEIYRLDDDVYVKAGPDEENYIGRISEFFEGINRASYFSCQWFFRTEDTVISEKLLKMHDHTHDHKRVFLSNEKNANLIECIVSKVKIIHVDPNMTPEAKPHAISDCDLYYDMSYSDAYSTFENLPADINKYACASLKHNHPYSQVRNEKAEDFLALIQQWDTLCKKYVQKNDTTDPDTDVSSNDDEDANEPLPEGTFEVEELLDVCYGDPNSTVKTSLRFKVRWKGYDASYDSWEPIDGLSGCPNRVKEFVEKGHRENILPLPGAVDVICGGPPCQGISGFNRFRKCNDPLKDEKNKQLIVFMDIVDYLRPKYVLMENVVDILKFADGFLGSYALSRLVAMNYQARLGMMTAGRYGLPQFRMRAFLWGALPSMVLPKFPLPTHDVVVRGIVPKKFSQSVVTYDEATTHCLRKALLLFDAISDLPKGANFRDLKGVKSGPNNIAELDTNIPRVKLTSGKPLVPNYAISFVNGKSSKPFGRLWWDETVPTVVTRAEPHNQIILHPSQDRVLTVRENARLQGFPDYYRLIGPVKQKYIQVGNAVAVPVARALGFSLGLAYQGVSDVDQAVLKLPESFIYSDQEKVVKSSVGFPGDEVVESEHLGE